MKKVVVFWFRRDLRLEDNTALNHAMQTGVPVLPLFIFDTAILEDLPKDDPRISFIYDQLRKINETLKQNIFRNDLENILRQVIREELMSNKKATSKKTVKPKAKRVQ